MATLSSAKTFGGIGGILVFVPGVSLVGWILILVALNEISDVVHDRSIFDDGLLAGITAIVGAVVLFVGLVFGSFFAVRPSFGFLGFGFWAVLALFWVFAVISSIFLKRAYDKIAQRLNVPSFATAGLLIMIGALTTIVVVGFLILFIALIFQVVAYFSIQDQPPPPYPGFSPQQTYPSQPSIQQPASGLAPPAQPAEEFKFCFKCGAKISKSAGYCISCGAKQS